MTTADRLGVVVEDALRDVDRGVTQGVQLQVIWRGEVIVDEVRGERAPGQPMTSSAVHNLYCGLKPVTALALAGEFEACGIDPGTTSVRDVLDTSEADPSVTIGDVLAHDAGLGEPRLIDYFLGGSDYVERALDPGTVARRLRPAVAEYSETSAWALLATICHRLRGRCIEQVFGEHVRRSRGELALRIEPGFRRRAIGCYYDMNGPTPVPLLHDRTERFAGADGRPAIAVGFASARALARWYSDVLASRNGLSVAGFPSPEETLRWTTTQRSIRKDGVLARDCAFGYGFMTDLASHGFGPAPSSAAFGGVGFMGNSFALADPASDLVIAYVSNGLSPDPTYITEVVRPARVEAIYLALGLG